ncbi:MAG: hypothetical protein Q7W16_02725 [Coriobacteriia bacterium]|nr:hypothetical protein [Coriobacteriia bacterium]
MSERTAAGLIDRYIARLKVELDFLGTAEADDLASEIRSLLNEAADGDADAAAAAIAKFGEPAQLAAGILAERGVPASEGMSTAEWWRMGVAVPLDILVGLAVPAAVAVPAYSIAVNGEPRAWSAALGIGVFACAIAWAWYVWKPWRTGGPRRTAGMTLTGLAVVRAPGFRRVVRSKDLEALGLRTSRTSAAFGVLAVAVAMIMVSALGYETYLMLKSQAPLSVFEQTAGSEAEQRQQVTQAVTQIYDSLVTFGVDVDGDIFVNPIALPAYQRVVTRAKDEKLTAYKLGEVTNISLGAWSVPVTETTSRGTHEVVFTVTLRIVFQPGSENTYSYGPDWEIYEIAGEGLEPRP